MVVSIMAAPASCPDIEIIRRTIRATRGSAEGFVSAQTLHAAFETAATSHSRGCDGAVWVDDVFLRCALIEILIPAGSFVQRDHGHVACLGGMHLVVQDRLHELPVVAQH